MTRRWYICFVFSHFTGKWKYFRFGHWYRSWSFKNICFCLLHFICSNIRFIAILFDMPVLLLGCLPLCCWGWSFLYYFTLRFIVSWSNRFLFVPDCLIQVADPINFHGYMSLNSVNLPSFILARCWDTLRMAKILIQKHWTPRDFRRVQFLPSFTDKFLFLLLRHDRS